MFRGENLPRDSRKVTPSIFPRSKRPPSVEVVPGSEMESTTPYVYLFEGQGSQFVGMGREFLNPEEAGIVIKDPDVRELYRLAEEVFGFELLQMSLSGPEKMLNRTIIAQPAIVTYNEACRILLEKENPGLFSRKPRKYAGHSLGQYSAYVAAGALSQQDAFALIKARAIGMEYASILNPGGNVVVTIQRPKEGEDAARYTSAFSQFTDGLGDIDNLWPGIFNTSTQTVYAGTEDALDKLQARIHGEARDTIRLVRVRISTPAHSPLMEPGNKVLKKILDTTQIRVPHGDIVLNTSARSTRDPDILRREILDQLTKPVLWRQTLHEILNDEGLQGSYEFGAKKVLSDMAVIEARHLDTARQAAEDLLPSHHKSRRFPISTRNIVFSTLTVAAGLTAAFIAKWKEDHDSEKK